jgi:hypothetical protein
LASPPDRLEVPTERDILSGMDIARSLLPGARPQVNLVPQQQETVVAIGALTPGNADEGADAQREAGAAGGERIDLRPFLISPVQDTLLGPASGVESADPGLGRAGDYRDAVDALLRRWVGEEAVRRDRGERTPVTRAARPPAEELGGHGGLVWALLGAFLTAGGLYLAGTARVADDGVPRRPSDLRR